MAKSGGEYVVGIFPILKKVGDIVKGLEKMGSKAGKAFWGKFNKVMETTVGTSLASMLGNALKDTVNRAKEVASEIDNVLHKDNNTQRIAKRYGVGQSNLDAAQRYAESQGVSGESFLSSFKDFANKVLTRQITGVGSGNLLDKYFNVLQKLSTMQNAAVKQDFLNSSLGAGMENLVDQTPQERNKTMRAIYANSRFGEKDRNKLINNSAGVYDKEQIAKQQQELERQQSVERKSQVAPNTVQNALLNESVQQTKHLKEALSSLNDIVKDANLVQDTMNKLQKAVDGILKIMNKIIDFLKNPTWSNFKHIFKKG